MLDSLWTGNVDVAIPSVIASNANNTASKSPAPAGWVQGLSYSGSIGDGSDLSGRMSAGMLALLIVSLGLFYVITRNAQGGG